MELGCKEAKYFWRMKHKVSLSIYDFTIMLMINEVYRFCSVLEVISSKENEKGKRAKKEKEKKKGHDTTVASNEKNCTDMHAL